MAALLKVTNIVLKILCQLIEEAYSLSKQIHSVKQQSYFLKKYKR